MNAPLVLANIGSVRENERLQLVLHHHEDGSSTISLLQQSWTEGVGWFTQSDVEMQPEQVAALRQALGSGQLGRRSARLTTEWHNASECDSPATLPFLRAESA